MQGRHGRHCSPHSSCCGVARLRFASRTAERRGRTGRPGRSGSGLVGAPGRRFASCRARRRRPFRRLAIVLGAAFTRHLHPRVRHVRLACCGGLLLGLRGNLPVESLGTFGGHPLTASNRRARARREILRSDGTRRDDPRCGRHARSSRSWHPAPADAVGLERLARRTRRPLTSYSMHASFDGHGPAFRDTMGSSRAAPMALALQTTIDRQSAAAHQFASLSAPHPAAMLWSSRRARETDLFGRRPMKGNR
jgi:hypothetical protein